MKPEPMAQKVRDACRLIDLQVDRALDLRSLAAQVGCSPFHLQRQFTAQMGVSPKRYHEARRFQLLKRTLRSAGSVTDAVVEAGFGSNSRVYEKLDQRLGMTPGQYRARGRGVSVSYVIVDTLHGRLLLAATDRGLCAVRFGADDEALVAQLSAEFPEAHLAPTKSAQGRQLRGWVAALKRHLRSPRERLDLPLDVRGTAFQMRVWTYLQTIPSGKTISYGEVAKRLGQERGARAVARACASNGVAIVVPCHRVLRGDGGLGGYRWGLTTKRALLAAEAESVK